MGRSKGKLMNIAGITIPMLIVLGLALGANIEPGQGKENQEMNEEEKAVAVASEPVIDVIFEETEHFFVRLDEEFAHIDIELDREPEVEDDRLLSGFIFELLREGIVKEGEVTLYYTEVPGTVEKERF
ncbi:hypothetical protein [Salimicrobium halophilum]|uniref:Uncharacterized protein n=1 Tax=Salimicrobium halophilum TaxID=86666 RepID=A0A1G8R231_9BACI|nr:hypothetical protein [Salimicrobium halophilum]SDJ11044.1 hypothetical protein SAMN04490247_0774 [Salimicrobium halophilum]